MCSSFLKLFLLRIGKSCIGPFVLILESVLFEELIKAYVFLPEVIAVNANGGAFHRMVVWKTHCVY